MRPSRKSVFLVFLCGVWSLAAFAREYSGTRGIAHSGALRGAASLNEGIYHNPATFAFSQKYAIEMASGVSPSSDREPYTGWLFGGSVVDAHSPLIAGGLGYYTETRKVRHGEQNKNVFHVALSKILSDYFSAGVTGKYSGVSQPSGERHTFEIDVGTYVVLSPKVQAGIVGHNLLAQDEAPERTFAMGARIQIADFFHVNTDILKRIDGPGFRNVSLLTSFEVIKENGLNFQGGLALSDRSDKNLYSLGTGWSEHKLAVSYAFQNSMNGRFGQIHALSLRVFF